MKQFFIWFLLFLKRLFQKPSFFIICLLIPATGFLLGSLSRQEDSGVRIAVFNEDSPLSNMLTEHLLQKEGILQFYLCETEEELYQAVSSKKAECGYIFRADLEKRLNEKDTKRSIPCIKSPSSVLYKFANEVVFSELISSYGKNIVMAFGTESGFFTEITPEELNAVGESFSYYIENGGTFSFEYETLNTGLKEESKGGNIAFPFRGIGSIIILVGGMFGTVKWFQDRGKGIFYRLPYQKKWIGRLVSISVPTIAFSMVVLLGIVLSGTGIFWIRELLVMALYSLAVTGFGCILCRILKRDVAVCAILPVIILGSLIFCPVFFSLEGMFPIIGIVGKVFLPYYYLKAIFGGAGDILLLGCIGVMLIGISMIGRRE